MFLTFKWFFLRPFHPAHCLQNQSIFHFTIDTNDHIPSFRLPSNFLGVQYLENIGLSWPFIVKWWTFAISAGPTCMFFRPFPNFWDFHPCYHPLVCLVDGPLVRWHYYYYLPRSSEHWSIIFVLYCSWIRRRTRKMREKKWGDEATESGSRKRKSSIYQVHG